MDAINSVIAKAFEYNKNNIRVFGTSQEPWFCAIDIAQILGYKNPANAVFKHVRNDDKERLIDLQVRYPNQVSHSSLTNNEKKGMYINESGLYALIFASKLEEALCFQRWVTKELLPSIRKNGYYIADGIIPEQVAELQKELEEVKLEALRLQKESEEKDRRIMNLSSFEHNFFLMKKEEVFYIATTDAYTRNHRFEFGGVKEKKDLGARLLQYNTGRAEGDLY